MKEEIFRFERDLAEIKTDVKWIKKMIEKGHECKRNSLISTLKDKVSTNRKLIMLLLSAIIISYIPFVIKFIIK